MTRLHYTRTKCKASLVGANASTSNFRMGILELRYVQWQCTRHIMQKNPALRQQCSFTSLANYDLPSWKASLKLIGVQLYSHQRKPYPPSEPLLCCTYPLSPIHGTTSNIVALHNMFILGLTSMVFPFIAVTMSPGLKAVSDGMFSHRGIRATKLHIILEK